MKSEKSLGNIEEWERFSQLKNIIWLVCWSYICWCGTSKIFNNLNWLVCWSCSKWIRKIESACYETNKSQIGSTKSNGLSRSIGTHHLHCWRVIFDPIWGTQAKRAILHSCHLQKIWNILCFSFCCLSKLGCTYVYIFSIQ